MFGLLLFPIGLIILIAIGYFIFRSCGWAFGGGCCGGHSNHSGGHQSAEQKETAIEVLKRRYANGEISKEQYEQMKNDLT